MELMNKNNKMTRLNLSDNKIRGDGARSLSNDLMNEKNKLTEVDLSRMTLESRASIFINYVDEMKTTNLSHYTLPE